MYVLMTCSACGKKLRTRESIAAKAVKCPNCGSDVFIIQPDDEDDSSRNADGSKSRFVIPKELKAGSTGKHAAPPRMSPAQPVGQGPKPTTASPPPLSHDLGTFAPITPKKPETPAPVAPAASSTPSGPFGWLKKLFGG